ncbi:MAG: AmmeMemoRadiSam system protein A [Bacteroidota bacterium]
MNNPDTFPLASNREQRLMLKIARDTLFHYLNTRKILDYDPEILPDSMMQKYGAFVTLFKGLALRGCIGVMESKEPLYRTIQNQVVASAISDPRFPVVKFYELSQIFIEISILGELKKIYSMDEIQLGKHGIYIKSDHHSGTLLPQVAVSTGWTTEEFLGHCSRDKAGLGWDGWKKADIFIYTATVFSEKKCPD